MGFFDDLMQNIAANKNSADPLFGGLIPRREEQPIINAQTTGPVMPRPSNPIRRSGMDRVSNSMLGRQANAKEPNMPGNTIPAPKLPNVVIDWTGEKLKQGDRALDIDQRRLDYDREKEQRTHSIAAREQDRRELDDKNKMVVEGAKLDIDRDKVEIDHRKQALEEWKSRNPEGEIKTDETGRIVVIDKRTGESIDTGLHADHLSEEEKLKIQHGYKMDEIKKEAELKPPSRVSPSQQRIAETDAANELLNDNRYAWLAHEKLIGVSEDGTIVIKQPKAQGHQGGTQAQVQGTIDEFKRELKAKASERMSKTADKPAMLDGDTVDMVDKEGNALKVPKNEVEDARKNGARMPGDPISDRIINSIPDGAVDDGIELYYNDKGKVIGARNKKNPGVSKFEER